jgi:4-hydroxybenzoate polyprenyltransferase
MSVVLNFAELIRWHDWGPGKITILFSLCFYIAATYSLTFLLFMEIFLYFIVFASAQSALGFVLNDWGDQELDRRQGKSNVFIGKSEKQKVLSLAFIIGLAVVSGIPFLTTPGFLVLWIAWSFFAFAYSLKPFRLKTRGISGMIISSLAQWSLPVLLVFTVFEHSGGLNMWLWVLALSISGATLEIAHQRYDRTRDAQTYAQTFAVRMSSQRIDHLYAVALLFDKCSVGIQVSLVCWTLFTMAIWWSQIPAVIGLVAYLVLIILTLPKSSASLRGGEIQDPYYSTGRSKTRILHETLPNLLLPLLLITVMTIRFPIYVFAFILFIVWRIFLGNADLRSLLRELKLNYTK